MVLGRAKYMTPFVSGSVRRPGAGSVVGSKLGKPCDGAWARRVGACVEGIRALQWEEGGCVWSWACGSACSGVWTGAWQRVLVCAALWGGAGSSHTHTQSLLRRLRALRVRWTASCGRIERAWAWCSARCGSRWVVAAGV